MCNLKIFLFFFIFLLSGGLTWSSFSLTIELELSKPFCIIEKVFFFVNSTTYGLIMLFFFIALIVSVFLNFFFPSFSYLEDMFRDKIILLFYFCFFFVPSTPFNFKKFRVSSFCNKFFCNSSDSSNSNNKEFKVEGFLYVKVKNGSRGYFYDQYFKILNLYKDLFINNNVSFEIVKNNFFSFKFNFFLKEKILNKKLTAFIVNFILVNINCLFVKILYSLPEKVFNSNVQNKLNKINKKIIQFYVSLIKKEKNLNFFRLISSLCLIYCLLNGIFTFFYDYKAKNKIVEGGRSPSMNRKVFHPNRIKIIVSSLDLFVNSLLEAEKSYILFNQSFLIYELIKEFLLLTSFEFFKSGEIFIKGKGKYETEKDIHLELVRRIRRKLSFFPALTLNNLHMDFFFLFDKTIENFSTTGFYDGVRFVDGKNFFILDRSKYNRLVFEYLLILNFKPVDYLHIGLEKKIGWDFSKYKSEEKKSKIDFEQCVRFGKLDPFCFHYRSTNINYNLISFKHFELQDFSNYKITTRQEKVEGLGLVDFLVFSENKVSSKKIKTSIQEKFENKKVVGLSLDSFFFFNSITNFTFDID